MVAPPSGPKLESLTHIDISKLSHSELHALSLCSAAAFNLRRTTDVVASQIDRSLFNESAYTRRQTFSRLSLSSRLLLPSLTDPEHAENKSIVTSLKHLIESSQPPRPKSVSMDLQIVVYSGERKRKRGRKAKLNKAEKGNEIRLEIVNKNGAVVDFRALQNGDELYGGGIEEEKCGVGE